MCGQCGSTISATQPVGAVPDRAEDFLPHITLGRVIPTIPHLAIAEAIGLIPLPSRPNGNRMGKLWVWVYRRLGQVRSINNETDINTCCLRSNLLCRLGADRLNERTGEMLVKNFMGAQLPFPFFLLPSSFSFSFISTSSPKSRGVLKLVSGSKRHIVNFGLKECFWWGQF